ncbi:SprT family protein [Pseudomonas sp. WN033]|nr:SprT family protein [Pseudomonas sp. WN033]
MDQLMQRLEDCYRLAEQHFGRHFPRPRVDLDLRGQRAGVAYLNDNRLRFNALMYRQNSADFLRQTVAHEVAHLIAHQLYGPRIKPHGREWQGLMTQLYGLPAQRCHTYQVPRRRSTQYLYRCGCAKQLPFTAQRHAWVTKGRQYLCRRCGNLLHFTGQQTQT